MRIVISVLLAMAISQASVGNSLVIGKKSPISKRVVSKLQKWLIGGALIGSLCAGGLACNEMQAGRQIYIRTNESQPEYGDANAYDAVSSDLASFTVQGAQLIFRHGSTKGQLTAGLGAIQLIDIVYNDSHTAVAEQLGGGSFSLRLRRQGSDLTETISAVRGFVYDSANNFNIYDRHGAGQIKIGNGRFTARGVAVLDFTPTDGPDIHLTVGNASANGDHVTKTIGLSATSSEAFTWLGLSSADFLVSPRNFLFDNAATTVCTLDASACGLPTYPSGIQPLSATTIDSYSASNGTVLVDWPFGGAAEQTLDDVHVTFRKTTDVNSVNNWNFTLTLAQGGNSETISAVVRDHPEASADSDRLLIYDGDTSSAQVIGNVSCNNLGAGSVCLYDFNYGDLGVYMSTATSTGQEQIVLRAELTAKTSLRANQAFRWLGAHADRRMIVRGDGGADSSVLLTR